MSKFERMQDSEFRRKIHNLCKGAKEEGREQRFKEGGDVKEMEEEKEEKGMMAKKSGGLMQFEHASSPSKEPPQGQFVKKEANPKTFKEGGTMKKKGGICRAAGGVGKLRHDALD